MQYDPFASIIGKPPPAKVPDLLPVPKAPVHHAPSARPNIHALIQSTASMAGVPVDIATRLVNAESSFNPQAHNPSGASGLTQLMPDTAKMLGVSNVYDPAENLAGGLHYLASLKRQFGTWAHALAAYNWGPGNVESWLKKGGSLAQLPAETRAYIAKIAPVEMASVASKKKPLLEMTGREVPGADPFASIVHPTPQPTMVPQAMASTEPTATPDATQPSGAPENPFQRLGDLFHAVPGMAQNALHAFSGFGAPAMAAISNASQVPGALTNAVLGAPQRFIAGTMAEDAKHNVPVGFGTGSYPNYLAQVVGELGGGVYGATHPNDPSVQTLAESVIPGDLGNKFTQGGIPGLFGASPATTGTGTGAQNDSWGQNIRHFLGDMSFQTATDPLTYLTAGMSALGDSIIAKSGDLGDTALRGNNGFARDLVANVVPHPEDRLAFTPRGQAAARGIRNSEDARNQVIATADADLLKKYATHLKNGEMTPEVEQRLLHDAYVYGTPEMRQEAIAHGYKPTAEEVATPPHNILDYHLKDEYFPHLGQNTMPEQIRVVGKQYGIPDATAPFQKPQGGEMPIDPFKAIQSRLASGRAAIRQNMTRKRMNAELGVPVDMLNGTLPADEAKMAENVIDPKRAKDVLAGLQGTTTQSLPVLSHVSDIGRDTLIGANPAPHTKNISMLSYLVGGIPGIMKGLKYAAEGVPKSLADRLENSGAGAHFMNSSLDSISPVKYLPWRKASQQTLDRVDSGMRAARLEQLDAKYGNTLTDYQKAMRVNEDIGDYRNSPAYVTLLKSVGAQFPQWHGYIVPTAVGRAVLRNPQRVEQVARATMLANQDMGNGQYNIDPGGPVSEAESYAALPSQISSGQWASSIISPSVIGPIGSLLAHAAAEPQQFGPGMLAEQAAQTLIPFFSAVAPQFGYNPYGSKASPTVRTMAAFFAAHPKARTSARELMIRRFMTEGMSRYKATQQAQRVFYRAAHP